MKQLHILMLGITLLLVENTSIFSMNRTTQNDLALVSAQPDKVQSYLLNHFSLHPVLLESSEEDDIHSACLLENETDALNALARIRAIQLVLEKKQRLIQSTVDSKFSSHKNTLFKKAQQASLWTSLQHGSTSLLGFLVGGGAIYYGLKNDDSRLTRSGALVAGASLWPAWLACKKAKEATVTGQETLLQGRKANMETIGDLLGKAYTAVDNRLAFLQEQRTSNTTRITFSDLPILIKGYNEDDHSVPLLSDTHPTTSVKTHGKTENRQRSKKKNTKRTHVPHDDSSDESSCDH